LLCIQPCILIRLYGNVKDFPAQRLSGPIDKISVDKIWSDIRVMGGACRRTGGSRVFAGKTHKKDRPLRITRFNGVVHVVPGVHAGDGEAFALFMRRRDIGNELGTAPRVQYIFHYRTNHSIILLTTKNTHLCNVRFSAW
jgi:hypothetical protein